jgi:cysteine desulfurase
MPEMAPIYLDHNATTPLLPAAWEVMRPLMTGAVGNPASAHHAGRAARRALEDAREAVAALLGAFPDEVIFTSGATEANNLAVFGLVDARRGGDEGYIARGLPRGPDAPRPGASPGLYTGHVLASPVEHPCVTGPLEQLAARGVEVEWLPVSPRGIVPVESVVPRVRPDTRLVSVMLANHETGALQPVRDIARSLPPGVPVHCDAAQAVGKAPVNFRDLGVTALTASAHKFGGPVGVGVLLLKRGALLRPLTYGGHQQQGRRPGTEPVVLAVGMAAALEHTFLHLDANRAHLGALRARLWDRLRELAAPVVLNGPEIGSPDALPTTLNVSFPGCRADVLLMALDLAGVACSTGSACSSGSLLPSPVLRAMGVPDEVLRSAIRFSFGPGVDFADIDEAADRIGSAVRRVREGAIL